MNDDQLEHRLRAAFDSLEVPAEVRQRTLEACDRQREALARDEAISVAPSGRRRRPRRLRVLIGGAVAACLVLGAVLFGVAGPGLPGAAQGGASLEAAPAVSASSESGEAEPAPSEVLGAPMAYVAIDINPSLELSLDQNDRVVSAVGVNPDGRAVLSDLDLEGLPYGEALQTLGESQALAPYLASDSYVQFSITADDAQQEQALTALSDGFLATLPCHGSCASVSDSMRQEAAAHGMGCGRYQMAMRLVALDPSLTLEECEGMSMRELYDRLAALEGGGDSSAVMGQGMGTHDGQDHRGHGSHHGQGHL